jgi:hypothetical protein
MPTSVEQLITIRDGYLAALAADAANPVPTHTIDGISVDANTWREQLLKRIGDINTLITYFQPQEIRTIIQ